MTDETRPSDPPAAPAAASPPARAGFPVLPLLLAALAAAAAWPVTEGYRAYFQPSEKAAAEAYNFGPLNAETKEANAKNGAICFGTLGALLGLGLGLAGGLGRRSLPMALAAGVVGLIVGLGAGALPALPLMPEAHEHKDAMLSQPAIGFGIHLGLWAPLGAAAGLAYALGRHGGSPRHLILGLVGGLVGAALGTVLYEILGAIALPMHATQYPFATTSEEATKTVGIGWEVARWNPTRLFALASVALGTALGAVLALRGRAPRVRPTAVPVAPTPGV